MEVTCSPLKRSLKTHQKRPRTEEPFDTFLDVNPIRTSWSYVVETARNVVFWVNPNTQNLYFFNFNKLQRTKCHLLIAPVILSDNDWGVQSPPESRSFRFDYHSQVRWLDPIFLYKFSCQLQPTKIDLNSPWCDNLRVHQMYPWHNPWRIHGMTDPYLPIDFDGCFLWSSLVGKYTIDLAKL